MESSFFVKNDYNYDICCSYLKACSFYEVDIDFFLHYFAKFLAYYSDFNLVLPLINELLTTREDWLGCRPAELYCLVGVTINGTPNENYGRVKDNLSLLLISLCWLYSY